MDCEGATRDRRPPCRRTGPRRARSPPSNASRRYAAAPPLGPKRPSSSIAYRDTSHPRSARRPKALRRTRIRSRRSPLAGPQEEPGNHPHSLGARAGRRVRSRKGGSHSTSLLTRTTNRTPLLDAAVHPSGEAVVALEFDEVDARKPCLDQPGDVPSWEPLSTTIARCSTVWAARCWRQRSRRSRPFQVGMMTSIPVTPDWASRYQTRPRDSPGEAVGDPGRHGAGEARAADVSSTRSTARQPTRLRRADASCPCS